MRAFLRLMSIAIVFGLLSAGAVQAEEHIVWSFWDDNPFSIEIPPLQEGMEFSHRTQLACKSIEDIIGIFDPDANDFSILFSGAPVQAVARGERIRTGKCFPVRNWRVEALMTRLYVVPDQWIYIYQVHSRSRHHAYIFRPAALGMEM